MTHLMGADLNNIVKCQKLTDDHVQFLIYQILRGLKVSLKESIDVVQNVLISFLFLSKIRRLMPLSYLVSLAQMIES